MLDLDNPCNLTYPHQDNKLLSRIPFKDNLLPLNLQLVPLLLALLELKLPTHLVLLLVDLREIPLKAQQVTICLEADLLLNDINFIIKLI